jgi:hypothetical protein
MGLMVFEKLSKPRENFFVDKLLVKRLVYSHQSKNETLS